MINFQSCFPANDIAVPPTDLHGGVEITKYDSINSEGNDHYLSTN